MTKRALEWTQNNKNDTWLNDEVSGYLVKRILKRDGDIPVSVLDMMIAPTDEYGKALSVSIMTRNDPRYRGKGYASKSAKEAVQWFNKNQNKFDTLLWDVLKTNIASVKIAEKNGFVLDKTAIKKNSNWRTYVLTKN